MKYSLEHFINVMFVKLINNFILNLNFINI